MNFVILHMKSKWELKDVVDVIGLLWHIFDIDENLLPQVDTLHLSTIWYLVAF